MLLDLDLPGADGLTVLERLRQESLPPTVVVITAFATIEKAVEAMRRGAFDFLPKPFQPGLVELTVQKALERSELREENRTLRAALPGGRTLVGGSSALRELTEHARKAAESKSTVLLIGESGTGKEVLARSIHAWSPRASRPFIAVNCVALSEELLESELFGHEKGAFTGAAPAEAWQVRARQPRHDLPGRGGRHPRSACRPSSCACSRSTSSSASAAPSRSASTSASSPRPTATSRRP